MTNSIDCPGCGGTRATHSLLTGNLPSAFNHNPLITTGIIFIAGYFLCSLICRLTTRKPYLISISLHKGIICLLIILAYTIARNF